MITVSYISSHIANLDNTSAEEDKTILSSLGTELPSLRRREITSELIYEMEDLLLRLYSKWITDSEDYEETLEDLFFEVRGHVSELGQKADDSQFDKEFFVDVFELGRLLDQLASFLASTAIPVIIAAENISSLLN